jgi:hypothetical protein
MIAWGGSFFNGVRETAPPGFANSGGAASIRRLTSLRVSAEAEIKGRSGLIFFDGDRVHFANLDAALAADTFFRIHGNGLFVLHLEHLYGADIHAFFTADAFFFIYDGIKSHFFSFRNGSVGSMWIL